jgi:murein DD-endopeptidase MepM/ murein hydrolase activator NlpD
MTTIHRAAAVAALGLGLIQGIAAATLEEQPPPSGCEPVSGAAVAVPAVAATTAFPPLQLELYTPFEPTAFPSGGRSYLIYELHLRSFDRRPLVVTRLDVVDAGSGVAVATFEVERVSKLLQPSAPPADAATASQLAGNGGAVAYLCLAFAGDAPPLLSHRVHTDNGVAASQAIGTRHTEVRSFGPPVRGSNWSASSAPSNDSHHRLGLLVVDGRAQIARRYAIDWLQLEGGAMFEGEQGDVRSYFAYDEQLLAVADGTVVTVIDGIPDNTPRTAAGFSTAVPMTADTISGNFIALDLGGGQFATYSHVQSGSLLVKEGDRVRRGQPLARIGNSGDARAPHLHFQVTTTPSVFAAEGVPYVIDEYRAKPPDGEWERRTNELPLRDLLVDFGQPL